MRNFLKLGVLVALGFIFCNIFLANPVRAEVSAPDVMTVTQSKDLDCVTNPSYIINADSVILDLVESKIIIEWGSLIVIDSTGQKTVEIQMKRGIVFLDSTWNTIYLVKNLNDFVIFAANNGKYNKIKEGKIEKEY
ncbi:MAG: hypothetical protein WC697_00830 [Patescibacteria group bacterium]|jgi:hypothetical protein